MLFLIAHHVATDQSCPLKKEDNVAEHDANISQTRPELKEDIKKEATEDQELDVKAPKLSSEEMAFLTILKSSAMPLDESLLAAHFQHGNIDWVSGLGLLASNLEEAEAPMGGIEEETKGSLWSGWLEDSCHLCVYSEVFNLSPATRYLSINNIYHLFYRFQSLCSIFNWTIEFACTSFTQ